MFLGILWLGVPCFFLCQQRSVLLTPLLLLQRRARAAHDSALLKQDREASGFAHRLAYPLRASLTLPEMAPPCHRPFKVCSMDLESGTGCVWHFPALTPPRLCWTSYTSPGDWGSCFPKAVKELCGLGVRAASDHVTGYTTH